MSVKQTYVSGGWGGTDMAAYVAANGAGWYYGYVAGAYNKTAIHYFRGGVYGGYSLCCGWGPSGVEVFGPIDHANFQEVRSKTSTCQRCRTATRKLGINSPESFVDTAVVNVPRFTIKTEVELDVFDFAEWAVDMLDAEIDRYIRDHHPEAEDDDVFREELLDWLVERIKTGA